jgi:hypothetical protein
LTPVRTWSPVAILPQDMSDQPWGPQVGDVLICTREDTRSPVSLVVNKRWFGVDPADGFPRWHVVLRYPMEMAGEGSPPWVHGPGSGYKKGTAR